MTHQWLTVECEDCGTGWVKREDSLVGWAGRCKSCANKVKAQVPRMREIQRANGKAFIARFGRLATPKMENRRRGPTHHNWRGGITPEVMKIRWSTEMRNWRKLVFERDGYKCIICGVKGSSLNADHIKPFSLFPELRFNVDNGRTLCHSCHIAYGAKVAMTGVLIRPALFP